MQQITALFLAVALLASVSARAAENYCEDPQAEAQWRVLLEKNPEDLAVQTLHALRVGLCLKVERGDLSLERATEIFEGAREALVEQRKRGVEEESRQGERL